MEALLKANVQSYLHGASSQPSTREDYDQIVQEFLKEMDTLRKGPKGSFDIADKVLI